MWEGYVGLKCPLTHEENSLFVLASHRCCIISQPSRAEEALCSFWLQATTFHDSTNISYFFTAVWIFFRHSSHWNITHTLHKLSANVKYSVLPKVVEGNSFTYTQPLRGRGISPRWRPGVHFQPVSACVTSASGSTCTALTRWERWRWFRATSP